MGELQGAERAHFIRVFLTGYNTAHGTRYDGEPENPEGDVDFRWRDPAGGAPLEVQHRRAEADASTERVQPDEGARLVKHFVIDRLRANDVTGVAVVLRLEGPLPTGRRRQPQIGEAVWGAVTAGIAACRRQGSTGQVGPVKLGDVRLSGRVEPTGGKSPAHVVWSPGRSYFDDSVRRLVAAVGAKSPPGWPPTGAVLAVHFDVSPYDGDDLLEMRGALNGRVIRYREVWAVSLWHPTERADMLWRPERQ